MLTTIFAFFTTKPYTLSWFIWSTAGIDCCGCWGFLEWCCWSLWHCKSTWPFLCGLFFALLVGCWIAFLVFRVQVFFKEFKPRVVKLLLDFIDNDVNFSFEGYDPKGMIPAERFFESQIFGPADEYLGEDLIKGQVRKRLLKLVNYGCGSLVRCATASTACFKAFFWWRISSVGIFMVAF